MLHLNAKGDPSTEKHKWRVKPRLDIGATKKQSHSRKGRNGSYQWALIRYQQNLGLFVQRDTKVDIAQKGT
jgi:hypothetical protein